MENNNGVLRDEIANMRQSFFDEGILDSYFVQLEQLEDFDDPNFVQEIFSLYFRDSTNMIASMEDKLNKSPPEFAGIEKILHYMKANCGSVGAIKVKEKVVSMRINIRAHYLQGAEEEFQGLKEEYAIVKRKLEAYFELLGQVGGPSI